MIDFLLHDWSVNISCETLIWWWQVWKVNRVYGSGNHEPLIVINICSSWTVLAKTVTVIYCWSKDLTYFSTLFCQMIPSAHMYPWVNFTTTINENWEHKCELVANLADRATSKALFIRNVKVSIIGPVKAFILWQPMDVYTVVWCGMNGFWSHSARQNHH